MKQILDLPAVEARAHFLKGSSYFNGDLPPYISFEPILHDVADILKEDSYSKFQASKPNDLLNVNYNFITNKDGKFAWRPYELIHPAIYVSLTNTITQDANWKHIKNCLQSFAGGVIDCCSAPVISINQQTDVATQITKWWQQVEQRSLAYSLEYSHLVHTDVTDCYGSLYTHSVPWALHGFDEAKKNKGEKSLLGNNIDAHIQAGRYGQTNGIAQGSVLMDFVAEIVLGYVDKLINQAVGQTIDVKILRYRDDYRIFAHSDDLAERVLQIVSDKLRTVGMKLGVSKTIICRNIVEGSVKADKLAGIDLQDLGATNAKTIQKQLLRLHSFGQRFPNSGALRRLVSEFHTNISKQIQPPDDLDVQVAIATDIAFVSPATFPAIAGILSHLISLAPADEKPKLWKKVRGKMARVPYNGYLEIWLQRVVKPKGIGLAFESNEPICRIVNGDSPALWECSWISNNALKEAMDVRKIVVADASEAAEIIQPKEIELFRQNAWAY